MDEALIKRVLPHSVEAEQSVIGSMLMDREAIIAASEIITGADFYQHQYGVMFESMVELFNIGCAKKMFRRRSAAWTLSGIS